MKASPLCLGASIFSLAQTNDNPTIIYCLRNKNGKGRGFQPLNRCARFRVFLNLPDRAILEEIIIPHFVSNNDIQEILFVGCDWYNKPYENWFQENEYWTIEPQPKKKKFGSKNHVVFAGKALRTIFRMNILI
jgi:hypothetical protein